MAVWSVHMEVRLVELQSKLSVSLAPYVMEGAGLVLHDFLLITDSNIQLLGNDRFSFINNFIDALGISAMMPLSQQTAAR